MKGRSVTQALEAIKMDFRLDFNTIANYVVATFHFSINFDEDMNKLSDRELKRRKELMDLNFERNRVKVGDPDFVYDKQVCLRTLYYSESAS